MKTPLGTEVDFSPSHIVLDGDPAPPRKGHSALPLFGPCLLWPRSPISGSAELLYKRWPKTLVFGRLFVKRFALCYQTVVLSVCLSCLSVCLSLTLVYCGQTVGWIKLKLGTQVGLGPGHSVLYGDPAPPPKRGTALPNFRPYLLWPNGWMDQDAAAWYGGRPPPRRLRVCLDGDPAPSPKKGSGPPIFGPRLLWPNGWGWMKMTLGIEVGLGPAHTVVRGRASNIFGLFLLWPNGWMHQDATW